MEKKSSKGLVVLVVLMFLIILGLAGYICYDKGVFDSLLGNEESKSKEKLSEEEVQKLYSNLVVNDEFGPYFSTSISVDNITTKQYMGYVMSSYVKEKGITGADFSLMCLSVTSSDKDNYAECQKAKATVPTVSGDEIKSFIKEKFNIDKDFDFSDANGIYISNSSIESFEYVKSEEKFYFGYIPGAQGEQKIFTKFIKSEQSGDSLYVYDKAMMCSSGYNRVECYKSMDDPNPDVDKSIYKGEGSTFDLDKDTLFEKLDSKINTFKHTFKKADDGKYYWYSSEIVNE